MKFDELWPDVKYIQSPYESLKISRESFNKLKEKEPEYAFRLAHYLKVKTLSSCCQCGELTNWLEINFEAPICSEECDNKAWKEYINACVRSDIRAMRGR